MTPYAPQAPQFQQQQPGQPHVIDASLGEILRAVVHIVAKDMHSDFLDRVARFEDPHALLQVLHEYNNANEAKIQRREHLQKAPAAPNGPRPKMPNGKVVRSKRLARLGQSLSKLWAKGASNTLTLRRNFMSRDNATKFESWNIKNEANRDTRHWDPQSSQQIQDYFSGYEILNSLEKLSQDAPEALRDALSENPNNPVAAVKALAALNQRRNEQLLVKAGLKKPAAKQRKGWDNLEISRSVKKILDQR